MSTMRWSSGKRTGKRIMKQSWREGRPGIFLHVFFPFSPLSAGMDHAPAGPGPERFVPYFLAVAGLIVFLSYLGGAYGIWKRVCVRRKWIIGLQIPVALAWLAVFSILLFFSLTVFEFGGLVVLSMTAFLFLHAALRAARMIRWAAAARKEERPDYLAGAHPLRLMVTGLLILTISLALLVLPFLISPS